MWFSVLFIGFAEAARNDDDLHVTNLSGLEFHPESRYVGAKHPVLAL
jgi:hypothetical protein